MRTKTYTILKEKQILWQEPTVGSVLCSEHKISLKQEFFAVIGKSHDSLALVRLFEHLEFDPKLAEKWYMLCFKPKAAGGDVNIPSPLYSDLSHLIVKSISNVALYISKCPNRVAGTIHKRDVDQIIQLIQESNTISKDMKDKYFNAD